MINLSYIKKRLQQHYDTDKIEVTAKSQSGGDIHQSYKLELSFEHIKSKIDIPNNLFAKVNSGVAANILESEFESLELMHCLYPNFYPQALLFDRFDDQGLLLMSYHDLSSLYAMTTPLLRVKLWHGSIESVAWILVGRLIITLDLHRSQIDTIRIGLHFFESSA